MIVDHGLPWGSLKFMSTGGEAQTLFVWRDYLNNLKKNHEETLVKYKADTIQNFQDYQPDFKSNLLLHTQVIGGPFDASRVNLDALSPLTGAYLDFDICFPSEATWEEFVQEWNNFSRLYLADTTAETSFSPITGGE
ncbi:hypothetical protein J1N35_018516 [Gossypium stocksii]|uniref:Uncharacterized protein n=1 Tax=Gossypium stocksii TaxID=47602 RepID=A0A9D3VPB5_9ROSI|nr:hypothetical protein J1N35_018516 [Gossypium stocksii]